MATPRTKAVLLTEIAALQKELFFTMERALAAEKQIEIGIGTAFKLHGVHEAKIKRLQEENDRLRRRVAELTVEPPELIIGALWPQAIPRR